MLTAKMIMELGLRYGEEFDRSQADKWVKGQNSSKAVRVMLAMMSAMSAPEGKGEAIRLTEQPKGVMQEEPVLEPADEVVMANYKYDAPGAVDGWKWDGRKVQVCFRESVYATREYVEIGGCVSLEGDLIRLGDGGKFDVL